MAYLPVRIKLLSPVVLSSDISGGSLTQTLDYIPGTSILGLFAAEYIKMVRPQKAHLDDNFYKWFLRGDLTFTNAYLFKEGEYGDREMLPTPMALKREKTGGRIINTLFSDIDEQLVPLASYSFIWDKTIMKAEPEKRISFHHARDRLTGHTKGEAIFEYESLLPGQIFNGGIRGTAEYLKVFKDMFGNRFEARLGKSKNTGYGRIKIELSEIEEASNTKTVLIGEQRDVIITFVSHCILTNMLGFSEPSLRCLKEYLEKIWEPDSFKICGASARKVSVENHLSVWMMKRPLEIGLRAGSTIRICFYDHIPAEDIERGIQYIIENGIGERRGEGFGQVKVNMIPLEEYFEAGTTTELQKPSGELPGGVKTIFKLILESKLKDELEIQAYNDADKFVPLNKSGLPSSSLLGKLGLMIRKSNYKEFKDEIGKLRKTGMDQLLNCRQVAGPRRVNLFEYIRGYEIERTMESICRLKGNYEKLADLIGYKLEDHEDFLLELWRLYFSTFLKRLRKIKQAT
ncbi:MAG: hypothetical protein GX352_02390 [Clostridiales bacterium]|nr:hypothetical protein [Clostridiales bacterium]